MKDIIIKLSKAKKVFPDKITKVRKEDLVSLAVDKKEYLTKSEERALVNIAGEMDKINNHEFMAIREGQRIKLRAID